MSPGGAPVARGSPLLVLEHGHKDRKDGGPLNPALWRDSVFVSLSAFRSVAAATTLTPDDETVFVSAAGAARTVTLPPAAGIAGKRYAVKKTDASANAVTLDGNAAETIDGAATYVLAAQYDHVEIISDGANWGVV